VKHGTAHAYRTACCRCETCREAHAETQRRYRERRYGPRTPARGSYSKVDQEFLSDLLHELFPDGLTDDCPARRGKVTA
jgi:hypothetical protein